MFASLIKYYDNVKEDFGHLELSDGTIFYDLLNTTFEYSILYPNNGNEENIIYKYVLKPNEEGNKTNNEERNKIKGGFNNILQNIILLLKQLILIIAILIIIVIIVFLIKYHQKNINK